MLDLTHCEEGQSQALGNVYGSARPISGLDGRALCTMDGGVGMGGPTRNVPGRPGAPGATRTRDLELRRFLLYPTELQGHPPEIIAQRARRDKTFSPQFWLGESGIRGYNFVPFRPYGGKMIVSLVLTLRPMRPAVLPAHLGRASHAAFLRLVSDADPALAERLHAPDVRRPFTCSTLMGGRRRERSLEVEPGAPLFLRYTGLEETISALLVRWAERPPSRLELEGAELIVEAATIDPAAHPWAGQDTYEGLASRHLLPSGSPSARMELEFASPTTFRSGGRALPVPLPDLVFGSLVEKWNAFSPVAISEEVRRFAEECLAISRYRLATRAVPGKGESVLIGFVGWCRYVALNRDRYWLSLLQLLTDYAFYAGVGYQTTVGLGQVRRRERHATTGEKGEMTKERQSP